MIKVTSKELCETFWKIESEYDALDYKISDVKVWQLARMDLYYEIAQKYGVENQAHTQLSKNYKIKKIFSYLFNSLTKNPFFHKNFDVIIYSHPRSKEVDGELIDIYTKYFVDELKIKKVNLLELEPHLLGEHQRKIKKQVSYTDFVVLVSTLFMRFVRINLRTEEKNFIDKINKIFSKKFNQEVDITDLLVNYIKRYKIKYFLYQRLLKKLNPKVLYIVVPYGNGDIVKAAKDLKIKVIELQHGIFSNYHLGYSYPNRIDELDSFPDEFLVWSQYWKELVSLPIDYEKIKIKPFEFLEKSKEKYKKLTKLPQVVVLSQGNVGDLLAEMLLENIKMFDNLKIVYKLHPGEYGRYEEYESLKKLMIVHPNIEIVTDIDLHKLLALSIYQIGVNSTALLEGVEFNCKTILFDTDGIEYMDKFIEHYNLEKVKNMFISKSIIEDFSL